MMVSNSYEETVGITERRWPASYNTCISHECPRCKAKPMQVCTQRSEFHAQVIEKGHPCLVRMALGEGWAHPVK